MVGSNAPIMWERGCSSKASTLTSKWTTVNRKLSRGRAVRNKKPPWKIEKVGMTRREGISLQSSLLWPVKCSLSVQSVPVPALVHISSIDQHYLEVIKLSALRSSHSRVYSLMPPSPSLYSAYIMLPHTMLDTPNDSNKTMCPLLCPSFLIEGLIILS